MTGTTSWHADAAALQRWVDGSAGPLLGASVEQHLLRCDRCRTAVAGRVERAPLDAVWDRVLEEVEVPRPGLAHRLLARLGVRPSDALLASAAPTLRLAWVCGLSTVLLFLVAALSVSGPGSTALFLLVAPLVPVAGVAAAYGPTSDPAHDVTVASPYPALRLVLLRTAAVLATSTPFAVVAGVLLPGPPWVALGWLVPAACYVAVVLAASTWFDPVPVAVGLALVWMVLVVRAVRGGSPLDLLDAGSLAVHAALAVVAIAVFVVRLTRPDAAWRLR